MWAIYGYEGDKSVEQDGSGEEGYVGPFGMGACCAGCAEGESFPCKYIKPYLPYGLIALGALLFLEVV